MNRPWLMTGLILLVVVLGGFGIHHEANAELQRAISRFRAALPPGAQFSYTDAAPRILARGAAFSNIHYAQGNFTLDAQSLTINNPIDTPPHGMHISRIHAQHLTLSGPATLQASDIRISRLDVPSSINGQGLASDIIQPARIRFDKAVFRDLSGQGGRSGCSYAVSQLAIDHYGRQQEGHYAFDHATFGCSAVSALMPEGATGQSPRAFSSSFARGEGHSSDLAAVFAPTENMSASAVVTGDTTLSGIRIVSGRHAATASDMAERHDAGHFHLTLNAPSLRFDEAPLIPLAAQGEPARVIIDAERPPNTDTMRVVETLDIPALAATTLTLQFDRIPTPGAKMTAETLSAMRLIDTTFTYRDSSLINRFFQDQAQRHQMTPDQYRNQAITTLNVVTSAIAGLHDVPQYVSSPDGHTLEISFHPTSPLPVAQLATLLTPANLMAHPELLQPPIMTTRVR